MSSESEIWPPALAAFPTATGIPTIIGVMDQAGEQRTQPSDTPAEPSNGAIEYLIKLGHIRVILRSLDDTATLNLSNGAVVNRATIVKPRGLHTQSDGRGE